jgi:hypothetical protein
MYLEVILLIGYESTLRTVKAVPGRIVHPILMFFEVTLQFGFVITLLTVKEAVLVMIVHCILMTLEAILPIGFVITLPTAK